MRKTIKSLEERLLYQQNQELNALRAKDKEIQTLRARLEERQLNAVGQILQSMATMMESASKTVMSLHRNL